MAEVVIEKYFTSVYRALKEKVGYLRIYIYNGNNSIKTRCLIGI